MNSQTTPTVRAHTADLTDAQLRQGIKDTLAGEPELSPGAIPRSITQSPASRRTPYDNRRVSDFRAWFRDNERHLEDEYDALTACYARIGDWDYFEFVAAEHEREEAGAAQQATLPAPPTFWQFLRHLIFGNRPPRPNKQRWPAEDCQ